VLEGSLDVLIGSKWRTLTTGEAASVPRTVHAFRVGGPPVRVRDVHRPALDFEPYIKHLCSAANKQPRGLERYPGASLHRRPCPRIPAAFTMVCVKLSGRVRD
jgi:hypothetical protein